VPKLAKTNLVFKFEPHCKLIIPSCKSTGRQEAFNVNGEKKTWKSVSSWSKIWNHCLNSCNNSVILSLYWFKSMFSSVVRILFRQRKWTVSSPESCVFHKDNFNLNATYGVVILSDKSFAALQNFFQVIQVLRNIHHKGKVLHLLWDEILTLACIFFSWSFQFPHVNKKNTLARHLGLAILNFT